MSSDPISNSRTSSRHGFVRRHVTAFVTLLLLFALLGGLAALWIIVHGVSARDHPTATEKVMARTLRHFAIPLNHRRMNNPLPLTADVLAEGRMHWADHCASCHGNDGRGQTEIGRNLYPKAPDMTLADTQNLSDGEMFAIIKNGIRLTGMPAWGDASGRDDSQNWKLIHFIRHLPKLTPEELDEMKAMNPVSPMEKKEDQQQDEFLNGSEAPDSPAISHSRKPHQPSVIKKEES